MADSGRLRQEAPINRKASMPPCESAAREALFTLLRRAAGRERPGDGSFSGLSAPAWQVLYQLAVRQGVAGIVWDGILKSEQAGQFIPEGILPRELRIQWCWHVGEIERRNKRQQQVVAQLSAFYRTLGIQTMLLKGHGLARCYPIAEHRPCGDIDIWLYGRQQEADDALQAAWNIAVDTGKHHHTTFVVDGVMVENHYDFLNVHAHASNRRIEQMLQHLALQPGEEFMIGGACVQLPCADFNALFLLRHAAAHFAADRIVVRHVMDWAMFVEQYHAQIDWPHLKQFTREMNMHRFLDCLNSLSIDWLGMDASFVPPFERNPVLECRVAKEILTPEFDEAVPKGGIPKVLRFKFRRWWANRWKHRIVYREGLAQTFFLQLWSHLLKPRSLRH